MFLSIWKNYFEIRLFVILMTFRCQKTVHYALFGATSKLSFSTISKIKSTLYQNEAILFLENSFLRLRKIFFWVFDMSWGLCQSYLFQLFHFIFCQKDVELGRSSSSIRLWFLVVHSSPQNIPAALHVSTLRGRFVLPSKCESETGFEV